MRKLFMLILIAALLPCAAQAKENKFSCDEFSVTPDDALTIMEDADLAGYEAAVDADYPDSGKTCLIASSEARDKIAYFAVSDTNSDARSAADAAAGTLLGSDAAVSEYTMGENTLYGFACSVDDLQVDIYYMDLKDAVLIVQVAGMDADQITDMLASISF